MKYGARAPGLGHEEDKKGKNRQKSRGITLGVRPVGAEERVDALRAVGRLPPRVLQLRDRWNQVRGDGQKLIDLYENKGFPSPRMRRIIRFVVAVAHRFPIELWKRRYGVEFVERLLDETLCTRKIRRVMISHHLVRLALEASTARFDILGAHVWIAPWQQLVAPQQATRRTKFEVVFDIEVTPHVFRASPVRLMLTSDNILDAFGMSLFRHESFGVISHEWIAETLVRYRMIDEMYSHGECDARVEQRKLLMQRVQEMEDEQVKSAFTLLSPCLNRPHLDSEIIISQSRMWQLAQRTLTKDVMWMVALSTRPVHRVSSAHRIPLRGGMRLLTQRAVDS